MHYFTSKFQGSIDFDLLPRLIREGHVYSVTVRETPPYGYQCFAELLVEGKGLTEFTVAYTGMVCWEDQATPNQYILQVLKAKLPSQIERHLLNKQKTALLCGGPLKWKGRPFNTVAVDRFMSPSEAGPYCSRCRLNSEALGWIKSDSP